MSREVDELFGGGEGAPTPRTAAILGMLVSGLLVGGVGLACTSVPGGIMVLMAWMMAEKEVDRVESGFLPDEARATVLWLQRACLSGVFLVLGMFVVQAWLFCSGQYDVIWSWMLATITNA